MSLLKHEPTVQLLQVCGERRGGEVAINRIWYILSQPDWLHPTAFHSSFCPLPVQFHHLPTPSTSLMSYLPWQVGPVQYPSGHEKALVFPLCAPRVLFTAAFQQLLPMEHTFCWWLSPTGLSCKLTVLSRIVFYCACCFFLSFLVLRVYVLHFVVSHRTSLWEVWILHFQNKEIQIGRHYLQGFCSQSPHR